MSAEPITVTVAEGCKQSGLGRTLLYELIQKNCIETIKIGRRRLIVYASLRRFLLGGDDD
jgi:excisionase family DNA binding protein